MRGRGSFRAAWTIRLKFGASTPAPLRRPFPIRTRFIRRLPLLRSLKTAVLKEKETVAALSRRYPRTFPHSTRETFTATTSTVSTNSATLSFLNRAKTRSSVGNQGDWDQMSPRKRATATIVALLLSSIASTTKNVTFGSCASLSTRQKRYFFIFVINFPFF